MKSSNSDSKSNANFHQIPDNDALGKPPRPTVRSLLDVAGAFLQLGCFSFGGPIAHLGYLRTDFVEPIPS